MSVLIHGLEIPQEGFVEVLIRDDGTVQQTGQSYRIDGTDYYTPYVGEMPTIYKAVPVPPHGALMDRDDFLATCPELVGGYKHITDGLVVIPAEEGET